MGALKTDAELEDEELALDPASEDASLESSSESECSP